MTIADSLGLDSTFRGLEIHKSPYKKIDTVESTEIGQSLLPYTGLPPNQESKESHGVLFSINFISLHLTYLRRDTLQQ